MLETWVRSRGGKIPWRRAWQPPPVFLPGESHGHRSLVGYSPWGCKESDMTERQHSPVSLPRTPSLFLSAYLNLTYPAGLGSMSLSPGNLYDSMVNDFE